jgi:hypothetical protein
LSMRPVCVRWCLSMRPDCVRSRASLRPVCILSPWQLRVRPLCVLFGPRPACASVNGVVEGRGHLGALLRPGASCLRPLYVLRVERAPKRSFRTTTRPRPRRCLRIGKREALRQSQKRKTSPPWQSKDWPRRVRAVPWPRWRTFGALSAHFRRTKTLDSGVVGAATSKRPPPSISGRSCPDR